MQQRRRCRRRGNLGSPECNEGLIRILNKFSITGLPRRDYVPPRHDGIFCNVFDPHNFLLGVK
ncbi:MULTISPECIES: hypothetical protein [unclassified Rickettsia]|uniref:hypothetical protein n=1 Tax=unclassified Rickettsia TaxID=114295 RepID=UPI003132E9E2